MESTCWSLLKVNPQKQRGYTELLNGYFPEIKSYFPVYEKVVRPHGSRYPIRVSRPVFPGYIFIMMDGDYCVRGPLSLPVMARWVKFGGKIEAISGRVIESLRMLEITNQLVREVRYVNPYAPGVKVRVHLPVQDIMGVIVKLLAHNRAVVDTSLCKVTVPIHAVQIM